MFDKPILFWGKVVDQNGAPVQGVEVAGYGSGVPWLATPFVERRWELGPVFSDGNGWFCLCGGCGTRLNLDYFHKPGYLFGERGKSVFNYDFTDFREELPPTFLFPTVFTAWKCRGYQPLVEKNLDVPPGRWCNLDLLKGTVNAADSSSGDFRMRLVLEGGAQDAQESAGAYDTRKWSVEAEAIDGGFVLAPGVNPYEAPTTGYDSKVTMNGPVWEKGVVGHPEQWCWYVKSRHGRLFSRVRLDVAYSHLYVVSATNLGGSHVLEPEPDNSPRPRLEFHEWVWNKVTIP